MLAILSSIAYLAPSLFTFSESRSSYKRAALRVVKTVYASHTRCIRGNQTNGASRT